MNRINFSSAFIAAVIALIIFCVIAVIFEVMPRDALPINFFGAALSALIGAVITLVLLRGQTDIEEKKGKDIRILEKKMDVFQKFINGVWVVWQDQIITLDEFQNLTSQYYQNLMIYLKDKDIETIGNALTKIGASIDRITYETKSEDALKLRRPIIDIINTLSAEINLGGKVDESIMIEHDKIIFPIVFRKNLLDALNKALKTQNDDFDFKKGMYEIIWEGKRNEFITFQFRKFPGVKLAIEISSPKLTMVFMSVIKRKQLDGFSRQTAKYFCKRFGKQESMANPIPDAEDTMGVTSVDFSKEESMDVFRTQKYEFPAVLAKRVLYHLDQWEIGNEKNLDIPGVIKFLEKHIRFEPLAKFEPSARS